MNIINYVLHRRSKLILQDLNGLCAINKPIDMLSHPESVNQINKKNSVLFNGPYDEKKEQYSCSYHLENNIEQHIQIWLINRLDYGTSGLILASMNLDIAKIIKSLFQKRMIKKTYYALVFNCTSISNNDYLKMPLMTWKDMMDSNGLNNKSRIAETKVKFIHKMNHNILLVELTPHTGFSHQLRYQCSSHGLPIIGDRQYGDFKMNKLFVSNHFPFSNNIINELLNSSNILFETSKNDGNNNNNKLNNKRKSNRLFLHSYSISINYEYNSTPFQFHPICPIPHQFYE
eukprot:gene7113-9707_t